MPSSLGPSHRPESIVHPCEMSIIWAGEQQIFIKRRELEEPDFEGVKFG